MSFNDEYLKLRKKRLEEEQKNKPSPSFEFVSGPYQNATKTEYDIAPVQSQKTENKGYWYKAGPFSDGFDAEDIPKAILGTAGDVGVGLVHGVGGVIEGISDLILYGGAGVSKLMGNDDLADLLHDSGELDAMDTLFGFVREATNIDDTTLLGDFGYGIAQGVGQVGAMIGTAYVGGGPLAMGMTGVSSMGSGMSEAYQGGATDGEALAYGTMSGAIDVGTELIFGGLGKSVKALGVSKGISSLDDVFAKKLSSKISNQFFKNATEYGVKAGAEGVEEFLAGIGSAAAKKLTYMSDEELRQLLKDENLLEQFAAGAIVSGIAQGGDLVKFTKTGRDFITKFSGNEEAVIEKVYNDRVAEAEQDGTKLTNKEKNELYEQVQNDMRKSDISTDTIESVLGGETYKTYKAAYDRDTALKEEYEALNKEYTELYKMKNGDKSDEQIDRQADLKKQLEELKLKIDNSDLPQIKSQLSNEVYNSLTRNVGKDGKKTRTDDFLIESYNERARRGTAFEADLSQYDDKTAEVVKRAIDSKILNNTRRTHEFVDMLAKISADKGVLFDFTNNQKLKESGFAVNGASINGYVTKDGITVNIDSSKAHNSIVGHEIAHVLEGTELYTEMQSALFEYAKSKKDYDGRRKSLEELYKNVEDADIDAELTADLVGDYLFTDEAFINNLSTKHRNVFQKIYDEIKYLLKVATKGSKEARQLEKVKRAFDKAYRANGKTSEGTKYSLSDSDGKKLTNEQIEYFKDSKMRDENGNLKVMYHGSQDAGFHVFDANMSDDDTSFFFVDSNDVAASYSGTTETYEAQTIRTAEDMNNFIESIGIEGYEVVEKDGKFTLLYEGDRVADSNTAKGIYEEFCWYEGVGEGDANYKVYLNLTNPLEVDAKGRPWNKIDAEFSQEVYDKYQSLTAEEKAALTDLAEWEDFRLFNSEIQEARDNELASAYAKMGEDCNIYDLFSVAADNFSEDSLRENSRKYLKTRDYAQRAKEQGYDGVIFKNIIDNGGFSNGSEGASTVAIAFESNQIKSVANEKPTGNSDIRYSLSSDSEGRELSAEQREYFKDSKIVDDNGSLKVMHHGSPETFTVFDKKRAKSSGTYGKGFYFTDSTSHAATYGKAYDVYLNITNPLQNGTNDITKDQIRKFVEAIAEDEDYGIDNYGYDATIDSVTDSVYGKSDFGMIMDLNISCVGNMVEAIELFNKVNGTNYNGIVAPTETVAFYPEQIKNVDNKAPTSNPDIRYSLSEYTEEEKKAHNKAVLEHFGKTYSWAETGYLLLDGTRLDLSGKHDGAPGGYRTVDHRDITEALGYDYGGGDYSGSLVQFMSEGNIRIIPECNGINLSVKPTKAQEQALSNYISRYRGEVLLDIDDLNGNTVVSVEYPYGTYYTTILNDIREWFDNGKKPENSGSYSLTKEGETPKRYGNYNIFGEDIRLEDPIQEDVALVGETVDETVDVAVAENATTTDESLNNLELQHKIVKQKHMEASKANDTEAIRRYSAELIELERQIAQTETAIPENEIAPKKRTPSKAALARFTKKKTYSGGFSFQGGYNADGKQYLSDGNFAVEFNDIDESIPHNKDFPIKKLQSLLNDVFDGQSTEKYNIDFDKIVEINKANKGNKAIVTVGGTPFDAKYVEAVMRAIPNATFALSDYRGSIKTLVAVGDNGRAMLMPVRAGDKLDVAYTAQEIKPTLETVAPMPNEPTLYELEQKQAELEDTIRTAMENNDPNAPKLIDEYGALLDTIAKRKAEESAMESERLASLDDMEAPPEVEAPYYGESADTAPENPFEDRDIKAVGNRKVKAYMYENPEVKPFFQEEANIMLGELRDGTKGERWFNDQLYYDTNGEKGFSGTKRHVSADIAYLLDNLNFSYADIEKGLNAIIEDNGKENNAASKRIEFILNDRLLKGYTDFRNGFDIPPNQDYINLLNEKQITEYSEEARAKFFEVADEYAPPMEDIAPIAPIAENITANEPKIDKPIEDAPMVEAPPTFDTKKKGEIEGQQTMFEETKAEEAETESEPPKVAKILTEEPEVPKKKNRVLTQARANLLDKGSVFEDLSLKTGNRELQGKYNFMHYSESRAQKYIAEKLKPIVDKAEQLGKTEQLYDYMYHLHNIDRMSLETEENRVKREALRERFKGYSDKQIERIAMEWIKHDTPKDVVERIKAAREYVEASKGKNKPVFGDTVTADVSRDVVRKLEAENPEFKELSNEIIAYNAELRQMLVDKGVISQETADLWAKMYPHYVPIRRLGDEGLSVNVPLDTNKTGINAPIKRATGGNRDILPLFDTMAMRTEQTFKAIAKNSFGAELMHTLGSTVESNDTSLDDVIDSFDNHDELLQEGKNGKNPTFTIFENGKRVTFEITEDMYDALKPTGKGLSYTNKVANTASNIFRGILTEYNPVFMASNAIKDVQDVLINSQHAAKTYVNIPKAIQELATKGRWYTEYMANGGEQNTYFDSQAHTFKTENKGFIKTIGMPLRAISEANNFIERVPRLAEYIASREAGRSVEVSMLDAARVTTNFAAGGDVTKFLNRNGATFLNASVQGFNQNVRNIREAKANGLKGWVTLAAKFALAGLPALLLNNLLWDDDEEYEELSEYVKDNYYVVAKTKDGKFIRIPKGRTAAVIQDAFEQIYNAATGKDEVDLKNFCDLVISNLAPNNPIENNILAPIIQVANNETWYGEDLVPTRLQDLPAAEQYDESTDAISKWLGEKLNYSPYKINYLLNQYSGGIGDVFLPMITPEAESGDNSLVGNMLAPMKDKFTTDSVLNNKNVSEFYETMDELTVNAKSSKATDEDILKYKYFNSVSTELSELYAEKREIQNSDLANNEKYEAVRELQMQINDLTRESLNAYKNVTISDNYATVGDKHYRLNNGVWTKISDKQLERQNEVTKELGISPEEYWAETEISVMPMTDGKYEYAYENPEKYKFLEDIGVSYEDYKNGSEEFKEAYSWAFKNPEKYTVSKAVANDVVTYRKYASELYDIKADKDEYGKSISGSRKEKVIDYVNNLDIDYGARLILFKSEYNADDTYNYDIIDYLNSREDISYEEMETILKELGFIVQADGTILWD